jgi:hypothetical protein
MVERPSTMMIAPIGGGGVGGHVENVVNAAKYDELVLENRRVTVVSLKQELEVTFRNNEVAGGIREWL